MQPAKRTDNFNYSNMKYLNNYLKASAAFFMLLAYLVFDLYFNIVFSYTHLVICALCVAGYFVTFVIGIKKLK